VELQLKIFRIDPILDTTSYIRVSQISRVYFDHTTLFTILCRSSHARRRRAVCPKKTKKRKKRRKKN